MVRAGTRSARAAYRTRQVLHALNPKLDDAGLEAARQILSPAEARLFFTMEKRDQRHALEVLNRLKARNIDESSLLKAALLHDCGKGSVPVWLRIARVISPAAVSRAGKIDSPGWRGAAYRLTHHAELGAKFVKDAGGPETTVGLIRGHVGPEDEPLLALLMAADDES